MNSVWKKISEMFVRKKPDIPKVLQGAGALICCLCEEEAKIKKPEMVYEKVTVPPETIANIVNKYGNRDVYRDVYQFIK